MTIDERYRFSYGKKETNDVLDSIKRDIFNACSDNYHMPVNKLDCDQIFEIIDKYKSESRG